jgi:maleylpyruvate isomerase
MPPNAWQRVVRYTAGQEPRAEVIVSSRLAEVLIHYVDLDLGYQPRNWPARFTKDTLSHTTAVRLDDNNCHIWSLAVLMRSAR